METIKPDSDQLHNSFIYEEDHIDNKADVAAFIPELICGVCNYILKNPLECKVCEKPICSDCKIQWFAKNPNHCPFCRSNSQFDKVNRITRNLLGKIRFTCMYRDKGCKEVHSYQDIFKHQESCPTIIFKCESCNYVGHTDNKQNHNCITYLSQQLKNVNQENQKLKTMFQSTKDKTNIFGTKLFYFAKLNQHAFYDFETLKWSSFKVFDRKISEGKIVVLNKQFILIVGGYESETFDWSSDVPSSQIIKFSIPFRKFKTIGEMMNNRIYFGIAQEEDEIYIIGGSLKGSDLKQCETFNTTTKQQQALPQLSQAVRGPNCCTFSKRYVYTVGFETQGNRTSIQQLDQQRGSWQIIHIMAEKKIWLVGLHMLNAETMIMFGGQAIHDNNLKFNQIIKYKVSNNKIIPMEQQLMKADKFFFNNQNIYDKESNSLYSMGRDYIHKISLDKMSCFIPDVGYVEYYSQ
ncbi:traf-type zinc finger family [Stylonychia lemnae]|uniref:Traf-type zinc finger family n=1 Tax=Stylonychia lemnae TaxID=5949 RepID=A0A078B9U3_STYLE|nr:traf-type zinc finger family [Stylonychia lemnae]|eukprot:CDW90976.1 traf-type zinc finger family [Stylonychia lemnae]